MKIAIVGAGGMGSVYGAKLSTVPENEVYLIDVFKEHVDKINSQGLILEFNGVDNYYKNLKATSNAEGVGVCDLAIIFVKGTTTESALKMNSALFGPNTMALTLQNGWGNVDVISSIIGEDNVAAGTTEQGAVLLEPGKVRLGNNGKGKTVIGDLRGGASDRIKKVAKTLSDAGFETYTSDNVKNLIWDKLLVNVGINGVGAATNLRNGQLITIPEANEIYVAAIKEGIEVAKALGVTLSDEDPVKHVNNVCEFSAPNQSSMLVDVVRKRMTEIDLINGVIVREGKRLGIPTPVNMVITNIVKIKQMQYNEA